MIPTAPLIFTDPIYSILHHFTKPFNAISPFLADKLNLNCFLFGGKSLSSPQLHCLTDDQLALDRNLKIVVIIYYLDIASVSAPDRHLHILILTITYRS